MKDEGNVAPRTRPDLGPIFSTIRAHMMYMKALCDWSL